MTPDSHYTKAELAILRHADTMDAICAHVGAGGSLEDLCRMWQAQADSLAQTRPSAKQPPSKASVRFSAIWRWICEDNAGNESRFSRWLASNNLQCQADLSRADAVQRAIAFGDVRNLFDDMGRVKPVSEWPYDMAMLIAGLDVAEMFQGTPDEQTLLGILKKVKLADRQKAIEYLAKRQGGLVDRRELSGKVTLEELVAGSTTEADK